MSTDATTTDSIASAHAARTRAVKLRRIIVGLPLAAALLFSATYTQARSTSLQHQAKQRATSHIQPTDALYQPLPLVTQPPVANLSSDTTQPPADAPPSSSSTGSTNDHVGPAAADSGQLLQGVSNHETSDLNNSLQATRQTVKLDDLH